MVTQVIDQTPRNQYTASAAQTIFPYTFLILVKTDITVEQEGSTLVVDDDYAVSDVGTLAGGDITLTSGATAGDNITIFRSQNFDREVDYQESGDFLAGTVNGDFNRMILMLQQNREELGRSLQYPVNDIAGSNQLPNLAARTGLFLGFDSSGNPVALPSPGTQVLPDGTILAIVNLSTQSAALSHPGIVTGFMIQSNYYDSSLILGSGGLHSFTGATTPGKAGNWPDADGFFYDADGKQFDPIRPFLTAEQFGALRDGATDDVTALGIATQRSGSLTPQQIFLQTGTYRTSLFRATNVVIQGVDDAIISVFEDTTPTMVQINDNVSISDIDFISSEANLDGSRSTLQNANNVTLNRCTFQGFRDTDAPINAWGLYFKTTTNARVIQCGFDDNSQADIAFVGDVSNVTIDQAYSINSTLHINFEPPTSITLNENITINSTHMSKLSLLENGTGGTANRGIIISGCEIDELVYDGAEVIFNGCNIKAFSIESIPFFGQAIFNNSLSIGPNLLDDPYMMSVEFSSGAAASNNAHWFMNTRSGAISGDQSDALVEDRLRFYRINPTGASGTINFRPKTPISATAGEFYLIAVTGRRFAGSSGSYIQIFDGTTDLDCKIFRQSNENVNVWVREILIVPATTGDFYPKPGIYSTETGGVDIACVTVHKVLITEDGGNAEEILNQYHNDIQGPRNIVISGIDPVYADANVIGIQAGDSFTRIATGLTKFWNGASWFPLQVTTTAALDAVGNAINTTKDKVEGFSVFNTNTNKPLWSIGPNAADVWVDGVGATQHSPS